MQQLKGLEGGGERREGALISSGGSTVGLGPRYGLTLDRIHLLYRRMGGMNDLSEVRGYLPGSDGPMQLQRDLIAHAVDHLPNDPYPRSGNQRTPYSRAEVGRAGRYPGSESDGEHLPEYSRWRFSSTDPLSEHPEAERLASLRGPADMRLGALYLIDDRPRSSSTGDERELRTLAALVQLEIRDPAPAEARAEGEPHQWAMPIASRPRGGGRCAGAGFPDGWSLSGTCNGPSGTRHRMLPVHRRLRSGGSGGPTAGGACTPSSSSTRPRRISEVMNDIDAGLGPDADFLRSPSFRRTASDEDFEVALRARAVVDLAVGITMGKHDCDRDTALTTLLRTSRSFNITVVELARALVATTGA
jgi:hypothetical protein